ncbi:P-type conjugative transfer protein TrbJ [Sphingomonas sp.]|jgi:P-type conjugative transfer protein TrbJ|uniref:P-type conjugative transfer protein TrbJ n=1 Tax=Sphingomonas sp. TaxID=28214 RepID=UPI002E0EE579|nr:P-type conjugative transfer protein TrbJ [Sphingomonas sp.]HEV7290388.1 P-type conjugative transfer protein TrbJ [Sphingomonas sp.]
MVRSFTRKTLIAGLLGAGAIGALATGLMVTAPAAHAQITVFDPSNYSQNLLTAARTLQQINNQIQSLQNEAAMILNQAKNLARVEFPELDALRQTIRQIDTLMGQAQGVNFRVDGLDQQFRQLFPNDLASALRTDQQVIAARGRLDTAMSSFRHTMGVQAKVVETVAADARTLEALAARSQGAQGALAAQQTTNQLLALTAKQQFQIQSLMAAQYRAETMEAARRVQAEADARAATRKFLGTGNAYTPER